MAINKKPSLIGLLLSFLLVVVSSVTSFYVSKKVADPYSIAPDAPTSKPMAANNKCPEAEACPDSKNMLQSCTPPEGDNSPATSLCNSAGRIESCGGVKFCCPSPNAKWTKDLTKCCVADVWNPDPSLTCTTAKVTQTSNCGTTREVSGTKTDGACVVACVDSTWSPDPSLTCTTAKVTQTSNCGKTRQTSGTKDCCVDTTWTPSKANTCAEKTLTQTSNCGNTREVDGTKVCLPDLSITTKAYQDNAKNKPGVYFIEKKTSKVSRDQYFVYTMEVKNSGTGSAKNFKISDTLTGQNQNMITFVDSEDNCSFDYPSKKLTCEIENLAPRGVVNPKFRVMVNQLALNGKVIRNSAKVNYNNKIRESSTDVLISSIVSCNEFCTSDSECIAGLACDVFSNKCRRPTCSKDTSCSCITPKPTATATKAPTATITVAPTDSAIDFPDSSLTTPTIKVTEELLADEVVVEEIDQLPQTGIFDAPQTAVLGGGLLLAILGLFLAL